MDEPITPALGEPQQVVVAKNTYERFLLFGGLIGVVVGVIVAIAGAQSAWDGRHGNDILVALGGIGYYDSSAGSAAAPWMWGGIVLAALGVILLIIFITIRASRRA